LEQQFKNMLKVTNIPWCEIIVVMELAPFFMKTRKCCTMVKQKQGKY